LSVGSAAVFPKFKKKEGKEKLHNQREKSD
jgi:hypothetical protein